MLLPAYINVNQSGIPALRSLYVTVADIPGTGIYLFWYESQTDSLQLITGA